MNKKGVFLSIFLAPAFALYAVFFLYPNIASLFVSLFSWRATSTKKTFIGLDNFIKMFEDPIFIKSLLNNLYFAFFLIVIGNFLALLFCALVTMNKKQKKWEAHFYRSVFFFPNLLSVVATSILWVLMYSPSMGIVNPLLEAVGLESWTRIWLGEPGTVKPAIIVYTVWATVGFNFLIYLAASLNIPKHLFESAEIDGAGPMRQFFSISLPLILGNIHTLIILGISSTFNSGFAYIKVMTDGGPNHASEILPTFMYRVSFMQSSFGYGAAIGVSIFVLTIILYFIASKIFGRSGTYQY